MAGGDCDNRPVTRAPVAGLLAAITLGSVVLVAVASRSGVGISPDSVAYVAGARGLLDGHGVVDIGGAPLTIFPPGLSLLLASLGALGVSLTTAGLVINLISVAAVVLLTFAVARRTLGSDVAALAAAALVGVAPATVDTASMLWTELAFTATLLLVLWVLTAAQQRGDLAWGSVAALTGLVWCAVALRYVGVVLILVATAATWMATKGRRQRLLRTAAVLALTSIGPAALVLRNLGEGAGALGTRYPGTQSPNGVIERSVGLWGRYVTQVDLNQWTTLAGVVVVALGVTGLVAAFRRYSALTSVAVLGVSYWLVIWWSQVTTRVDVESDRLAYPVLPATVILCWAGGMALVRLIERRRPKDRRIVLGCSAGLVVLLLLVTTSRGVWVAVTAGESPRGYASPTLRESPIARAIIALPAESGVAATDPWLVWWLRGAGVVVPIPPTEPNWPPERTAADLAVLKDRVRQGEVSYLVYLDGAEPALSIDQLRQEGLTTGTAEEIEGGRLIPVAWGETG